VLDADALTSFADAPDTLFDVLHDHVVLTPHEGEFARLFPDLSASARLRMSRVDAARVAAERAGCFILLKGPATVIASPGGATSIHAAIYERRVPWLGTAGAGDVLAGLIAGLLAAPLSGQRMLRVLEAAAYLHAEAARTVGPGLIAEDLPDVMPQVLRRLGL
jgi:NAD(P)H-hydrate repair Nnr-like enzyme with NAD(P)H-hydrate dehydratase domain